jgi:hypothetical protein
LGSIKSARVSASFLYPLLLEATNNSHIYYASSPLKAFCKIDCFNSLIAEILLR